MDQSSSNLLCSHLFKGSNPEAVGGVLIKNLAKFVEKHLCQSQVAG